MLLDTRQNLSVVMCTEELLRQWQNTSLFLSCGGCRKYYCKLGAALCTLSELNGKGLFFFCSNVYSVLAVFTCEHKYKAR